MPSLTDLMGVCGTEALAKQFLLDVGVVSFPTHCPHCGGKLTRKDSSNPDKGVRWQMRCKCKAKHPDGKDYSVSALKGTFFKGSGLALGRSCN